MMPTWNALVRILTLMNILGQTVPSNVNSRYFKIKPFKIYINIITGAVTINWLIKPINYFISD
jgi:hypothetical protein